jgi:hypothetical protein
MSMNAKRITFLTTISNVVPHSCDYILLDEHLRKGVNVSLPDKSAEGTMHLQNSHDARPHKRLQYVNAGLVICLKLGKLSLYIYIGLRTVTRLSTCDLPHMTSKENISHQ